ncbi:MAG: hypothetical protein HOI35_17775 [Woeseia sp.]|jgi:hypothetical protein|nr:hypothetical protein [Woeseia sp.]MBT6211853.1 hypothetical protein [Woeseia sp.]
MSALAEGADQLVAEVAVGLGIPLIVSLPMPKSIYAKDFQSAQAREKFEFLLSRAAEAYELPISSGNDIHSISEYGDARDQQYAQLGVFLCAHCHILLALWDGKHNDKLGGTSQVVRFHHDDVMPGYTSDLSGSGLILANDESDLVYHIVCSRDRENGGPEDPNLPGETGWFYQDDNEPRSKTLPERHRRVFRYTSEFSADTVTHSDAIKRDAWALIDTDDYPQLPPGLRNIDHVFRAADWLAIHYQKRVISALVTTHVFALLMGLCYIAYSDIVPDRIYLFGFLGFFCSRNNHPQGWRRSFLASKVSGLPHPRRGTKSPALLGCGRC